MKITQDDTLFEVTDKESIGSTSEKSAIEKSIKDQKDKLELQSLRFKFATNRIGLLLYIIISFCFCYKMIEFTLFSKENIIKFLLNIFRISQ